MDIYLVRGILIAESGFMVTMASAKAVVEAYKAADIPITSKSLKLISKLKKESRNFKWENTGKVIQVMQTYADIPALSAGELKAKLSIELGCKSGKISKLFQTLNLTQYQDSIPSEVCQQVLIRASLFNNKPYQARG